MIVGTNDNFHLNDDELDFYASLLVVKMSGIPLTTTNIEKVFQKKLKLSERDIIVRLTVLKSKRWLKYDDELDRYDIPSELGKDRIEFNLNYVFKKGS